MRSLRLSGGGIATVISSSQFFGGGTCTVVTGLRFSGGVTATFEKRCLQTPTGDSKEVAYDLGQDKNSEGAKSI